MLVLLLVLPCRAFAVRNAGMTSALAANPVVLRQPYFSMTNVDQQPAAELSKWRRDLRKEMVLFAGPALSTVLADPLMSVVDAVCCGRFCSTLQLASLGPSLAVFNFVTYAFFFLSASTTVLVTRALACDDAESAERSISNAILLAAGFGVAVTAGLTSCAAPLVASTGCVASLVPAAARYLRVRALGQPFVLSTMVVQSGLLAQRDSKTPLQVISAACALNIIGDILLVPRMGAVGAAWATLASQLVALPLMLFLSHLRRRLAIRLRRPRLHELRSFLQTAVPLLSFEVGMNVCYSTVVSLSTQFSVASAAAFQALWTPVAVLQFASYPLKQVGQVFLPRLLADEDQTIGGESKTKQFTKTVTQLSLMSAGVLAAASVAIAHAPWLLTADATIWPMITSFAPFVAASLLVVGPAQVLEGILLACNDLKFLSWSQLTNVAALVGCLHLTKVFGGARVGIYSAWMVFLAFLLSRLSQALVRVFITNKPWEVQLECEVPEPTGAEADSTPLVPLPA
jgi:putative MATE family efflux protein